LELLNQKEHKATKELAQTPLLLTFLCLLYDRKQMLPSKRSTLYGRALDIILDEWSAQKRLERDPIHERLNPDLEKILLAEIAYESFSQDQLFFSKEVITKRIASFLADTLENPKYLDADKVLTAIEVQQGILVERATDAYSFSHLTLQEYLAALHIVENQLEGELVSEHLFEESWREVFLLVSGLMGNRALQLLTAMERKTRAYIEPHDKLKNLVQWAAVNKVGESKLYERAIMLAITRAKLMDSAFNNVTANNVTVSARYIARDIALAFAGAYTKAIEAAFDNAIFSARTNAKARARTLFSSRVGCMVSESASAFAEASASDHHYLNALSMLTIGGKLSSHEKNIPNVDAPSEAWQNWVEQLELIWLAAFELTQDAVTFSEAEAEVLRNYLYATELLIHCKESAIRVSRSEWAALEARLLTI